MKHIKYRKNDRWLVIEFSTAGPVTKELLESTILSYIENHDINDFDYIDIVDVSINEIDIDIKNIYLFIALVKSDD